MPSVVVERHEGVAEITLNRPEVLNAVNYETIAALAAAVAEAAEDRAARAVDDHCLSLGQLSVVEQRLPRRQAGPRHRCGVDMVGSLRLRGQVTGLDGNVLGGRPVTPLVGQPEHLVADGESGRAQSQRGDDPRHLGPGDN